LTPQALVIGGTGPTGPFVVAGLAERGFDVTILHGGHHEVDFPVPPVGHIHADPHFHETLETALHGSAFELVIAQYGRLRVIIDVMRGRTERLIAIGGATGIFAGETDSRWGELGRPVLFPETTELLFASPEENKLQARMVAAMTGLFEAHAAGHFKATYIGYPINYGPRQPAPHDWSIVRRVLDGRPHMVVADGAIKLESRLYTENAAHAVLSVVDHPDEASGQRYAVADERVYSMRQRIEYIAGLLDHELELIDLPYEQAWPCHPLWRFRRGHDLCQSVWIRQHLGFRDAVDTQTGLARTVEWLQRHPPDRRDEASKLGDPFDYTAEDDLIARCRAAARTLGEIESFVRPPAHMYRHPKQPGAD
jgi:nucleoside-diphosphate-sugar epimerase